MKQKKRPNTQWQPMYASQEKIYPREVTGLFNRLRTLCVYLLLGLYYILPWVQWDNRQAVLLNLEARKFYIFDIVFWPQDFYFLAWLLIMAGLTLFFVTALAGRIWCGYACPQTVWTEVFIWMERWTEGNRMQRIKLDRAPWTAAKIIRKSAKQILWVSFALFTGITFVGFFTPISTLFVKFFSFSLGPWEAFWIYFYAFATYGNAGFLREQVCKYMCPYARFQSAMFDQDSLIVSYDHKRGEPRGSRKRGVDKTDILGDCIDCTLCVQVCPTGIDIRDGLQYECIACAACVDVCDQVMDKMDYPKGLIRYTTQNNLEHKKSRILRPRTLVYATLLATLFIGFLISVYSRIPLAMDILRDRNALYRIVNGDQIENVYTLKLMNMDIQAHEYQLNVSGIPGLSLDTNQTRYRLNSGEILDIAARIRAPKAQLSRGYYTITIQANAIGNDQIKISEKTRFLAPLPN